MEGRLTLLKKNYLVIEEDAILYILMAPDSTIEGLYASLKGVYDALFERLENRTSEIESYIRDTPLRKEQSTALYNAITAQEYEPYALDLDELLGYRIEFVFLKK